MATARTREALRLTTYSNPLATAGPISLLRDRLQDCTYAIEGWPTTDRASHGELILVFENHTDWFAECQARFSKKWDPNAFRIIAADMPTAAKLNHWIRQRLYGKERLNLWQRGETIRLLDAHYQQGQQVAAAGTEYRILRARQMVLNDHAGEVNWQTPTGKPRSLQLAISGVTVQAVELQPLDGGVPITVMIDLPGQDSWHRAAADLKQALRSAAHSIELHAEAISEVIALAQRVVRVRPCAAITPELIGARRWSSVALHPDFSEQGGEGGVFSTQIAAAAAIEQLLVVRQKAELHRW